MFSKLIFLHMLVILHDIEELILSFIGVSEVLIQTPSYACWMQVHPSGHATAVDPAIIQLELALVDVFIGLCRLEWQAGYQELATALFQAELEYSLFSPFGLSEQSKRRLFEHFWGSNGARIGEDGALGWSTWLEKEEEQRQRLASEEASNVVEEGGWTGWFEPLSKTQETEMPESTTEKDLVFEEFDVEDTKDFEQKNDVESLLKALGIDAAAEADIKVKDTKTWTKWSKAEMSRDLDQWMPLRPDSGLVSYPHCLLSMEHLFYTILYSVPFSNVTQKLTPAIKLMSTKLCKQVLVHGMAWHLLHGKTHLPMQIDTKVKPVSLSIWTGNEMGCCSMTGRLNIIKFFLLPLCSSTAISLVLVSVVVQLF